jgi:hypothetical protein
VALLAALVAIVVVIMLGARALVQAATMGGAELRARALSLGGAGISGMPSLNWYPVLLQVLEPAKVLVREPCRALALGLFPGHRHGEALEGGNQPELDSVVECSEHCGGSGTNKVLVSDLLSSFTRARADQGASGTSPKR